MRSSGSCLCREVDRKLPLSYSCAIIVIIILSVLRCVFPPIVLAGNRATGSYPSLSRHVGGHSLWVVCVCWWIWRCSRATIMRLHSLKLLCTSGGIHRMSSNWLPSITCLLTPDHHGPRLTYHHLTGITVHTTKWSTWPTVLITKLTIIWSREGLHNVIPPW